MADIFKSVDIISVNFEQVFTYNINISFDGIVGSIDSASVIEFIPEYIEYTLPKLSNPIKSIEETVIEGGTLINFKFGAITNVGISLDLKIKCKFKLGTESGTTYTNKVELYINESLEASANSEVVTLYVVEDFFIDKKIVVPNSSESAPGGRVIYTITIKNNLKINGGRGDLGAKIKNISINDILPYGISLDSTFDIVGYDTSNNSYSDKRYDGKLGEINDNIITFNLPQYHGTSYRIVFVANVDDDVSIGSVIYNSVTWKVDSNERDSSDTSLTIGEKTYGAYLSKYGPRYAQVGNYSSFDINVRNNRNQDLKNCIIEEVIPYEIYPYKITTGIFKLDVVNIPINTNYTIEYEINNSGEYNIIGTYNLSIKSTIDLPILQENQKITKIIFNISNLPVGTIQSRNITIDSIVKSTNSEDKINSISRMSWDNEGGRGSTQYTHKINISQLSELRIEKKIKNNITQVIPGQIIRYAITFNGNGSQVNNPVVSDFLSEKLLYLGNEKYIYYDYFNNSTIDSNRPDFFSLVNVNRQVINDFNSTSKTLVRYSMNEFRLRQRGIFTIEFDVKVRAGAIGIINNSAMLGNIGNLGVVGSGYLSYKDIEDRDGDFITDETIAMSNNIATQIVYYAALSSIKKVKGDLDNGYVNFPIIAKTYEGGNVDYRIEITNIGNLDFNYVEIIDILPHIQDSGVIITNIKRLSEFAIYNIKQIEAKVIDLNGNISNDIILNIEYSSSYNPIRFSKNNLGNDSIGSVGDWNTIAPITITDTKSIKINTVETIIKPNQSLVIDMKCVVPAGIVPTLISWNSFAVKSKYNDEIGRSISLIPVEPQKVGVQVLATDKSSIEGFMWLDKNKNGMIDIDEEGINSIKLKLYTEDNTFIKETITSNNNNNQPGYYIFNNLETGNYYIEVSQSQGLYQTFYSSNTDNKFYINTSKTKIISINSLSEKITNINGGFIKHIDITLMILEFLHEVIYSINCESTIDIVNYVNYANSILVNILSNIENIYRLEINSQQEEDLAYLCQIERLIYILKDTISKLIAFKLPKEYCNLYVITEMIYTLTEYAIELIKAIEYHEGINNTKSKKVCTCQKAYELLVGDLINSISTLNKINNDLGHIVGILYIDFKYISRRYIPIYIPKK